MNRFRPSLCRRAPNGWAEEQKAKGLTVITPDDIETAGRCCEKLLKHKKAGPFLVGPGHSEVSMFYTRPDGIRLKARIDRVPTGSNTLVDMKKTQCCAPGRWCVSKDGVEYYQQSKWSYEIEKHRYHWQAGLYLWMCNQLCDKESRRTEWIHVCVEEDPPHKVQVFQMEHETIEDGLKQFNHSLDRILECEKTGTWPGYEEVIDVVGLNRREA